MQRRVTLLLSSCLLLAILSVLVGFAHFIIHSKFDFLVDIPHSYLTTVNPAPNSETHSAVQYAGSEQKASAAFVKNSTMDPVALARPRLECPETAVYRYDTLQHKSQEHAQKRYFFALDLHQCANLLPRLIGSIFEAIRFLGPELCALSIVEGRSSDGTFEILDQWRTEASMMNLAYYLQVSDLNPAEGPRIDILAELRNQAIEPLIRHNEEYIRDTVIIFLNDVAICMEDILELVLQRQYLGAHMVCAMDWTYVGDNPTFYDVWVARGMTGDTFFNIPPDGSWDFAWNLFWNDAEASGRFFAHKPFQVYSCWNGATALNAEPFVEQKVKFRGPLPDKCFQGEPQLLAEDLWSNGYGKIAVIPSVSLEYSDEAAKKLKELKGYTSQWVNDIGFDAGDTIDWLPKPPDVVKCIPGSYEHQEWVPWNESLIG